MKYGLTRIVQIYSFEDEKGEELVATPGDYLQANMWSAKSLGNVEPKDAEDLLGVYAWVWFALKRLGKLDEYGIAAEIDQAALIDMAGKVSVYLEEPRKDSLPLATEKAQGK